MSRPAHFYPEPWEHLRQFTDARIALGRAGQSMPTHAHLGFQLAHAQAKDAVYLPMDIQKISEGITALGHTSLALHSAAADRAMYVQRPDFGRILSADSRQRLQQWHTAHPTDSAYNVAFVVADGLSALAIHDNAVPLLETVIKQLKQNEQTNAWRLGPVVLVEQGRVAVGDDVGEILAAELVVVLVGERPGLSSPNSLGIYFSWTPRRGLNDAQRNCISNVRVGGLSVEEAGCKLVYLLRKAQQLQLTGVGLKDDQPQAIVGEDFNKASLR